jgi:TolB protein
MQFANKMRDVASPVFSPDGKRLAFVASSPLYPQIYTMDVRGTNVKRLVPPTAKLRNERTAPDWSPDGSTITYQQQNKKFQVWMAHLNGRVADTVTRITNQWENEDPAWAPDGRHIVLTSNRGGDKQLWILDLISGRWRQLTTNAGARLASWSPWLVRRSH